MTTDKLLYQKLTYKIRGAIFNVYNELGFDHKENVYHRALKIELAKWNLNFEDEKSLVVKYDNQIVGHYRPDFVVANKILIEIKAIPFLGKETQGQMLYYLKGTGFKLGLMINFGSPKLQIKRVIWTSNYHWTNQRKSAIIRGNL